MILVYNKQTKTRMTLSNMNEFQLSLDNGAELELISENYKEGQPVEKLEVEVIEVTPKENNELSEIEVAEILPDSIIPDSNIEEHIEKTFETKEYSVKTFRANLESFNEYELKVFINFDKRQTIIKEAKKQLEKITAG